MHASRRLQPTAGPPAPDPVQYVWRCPSKVLSAADKRAWEFLFRLSGGGRELILTTPTDIGHDQGTSSDAGKDRLDNLARTGFIRLHPWTKKGVYKIEVVNPWQALRAVGGIDPQLCFPFGDEATFEPASDGAAGEPTRLRAVGDLASSACDCAQPEVPPEVPPEEPRRPHTFTLGVSPSAIPTSPFNTHSLSKVDHAVHSHTRGNGGGTSGGSSGETSADDFAIALARRREQLGVRPAAEPPRIASQPAPASRPAASGATPLAQVVASETLGAAAVAIARAEHLASPEVRYRRVDQLVGIIRRRVNRPGDEIYRGPCARIAWAIVDGHVRERDLYEALDTLDELARGGRLERTRSAYVNGAIRRLLDRAGVRDEPRHEDTPPGAPR